MTTTTSRIGTIIPFDVHTSEWVYTSDMDTGRPVWEYLVDKVKQGSLLVGDAAPYSVYGFDWHPNFYAQTHFHDVDQIQLIVHGEIRMGNRRLRPGHGVYTPAGRAYNFSTGPIGAIVIEFRGAPTFRMGYKERDIHLLGRDIRRLARGDDLPTPPPLEIPGFTPPNPKAKTIFFDTETSPELPVSGGLAWDSSPVPEEVAPDLTFQALVTAPECETVNLLSFRIAPDARVPRHAQDTHRTIYGLDGELSVGGETIRSDKGCFVPAGTPVELMSGPAGARFLEFHAAPAWHTDWHVQ